MGIALCYGMRSCRAINERPCVDLVMVPLLACVMAKWYLEFPYFLRDLVRLQYHVRPGRYQEEVYIQSNT